jgi:glycosyltransferase involved in cell wall biosynthesis
MIIIVVNFNRPNFLAAQIPLILKNLEPDNIHVVNTGNIDSGCREIAAKYDCKYSHLEVGTSDFSKSHASALNVAYNLNKQDHEIIGILDHDCFPIAPIDIRAQMEGKSFFASDQTRLGINYPNPACLFIRTSVGCIDFMPCKGMDTGGQLHAVYNQVQQMAYSRFEDYEIFAGAFLHIIKGSNWVGEKSNAERVARVFNDVVLPLVQ